MIIYTSDLNCDRQTHPSLSLVLEFNVVTLLKLISILNDTVNCKMKQINWQIIIVTNRTIPFLGLTMSWTLWSLIDNSMDTRTLIEHKNIHADNLLLHQLSNQIYL